MAWLRTNGPFVLLIALAAGASFVWSLVFASSEEVFLTFWMLDIGQGDALFIETPDHYQILIDGGPNANVVQKLGEIMPFWDRTIDLVVLSHPHVDHVSGLIEILKRYEVAAILESNAAYETNEHELWQRARSEEGALFYSAEQGMRVEAGRYASISVLHPFSRADNRRFKNVHDANVVLMLDYGDTEFLLMGDAEDETEHALIERGLLQDIEVLKVGHHGSRTSTSPAFLSVIQPEIAAVSAGEKNRYGHPAKDVIERLQAFGVEILRTDLSGSIRLQSDGAHVYQH